MTTQLHDIGEQFERSVLSGETALPASVEVALFHDGERSGDTTSGDDLVAGDDLGAITTEPDGGSYSRQTVSLDGTTSWTIQQDANEDYEMVVDATLSFDLSDSSNPSQLDAYAVIVNWDAGGGVAPNLWWTDTFDEAKGISLDQLDLDGVALAVSGQNAP